MRVEFGSVNADELGAVFKEHSAASAHAGTVDHYRIQAHDRGDIKRFCREGNKFHHNGRTYRPYTADLVAVISEDFLERFGDQRFSSMRAIIRTDDEFIRDRSHPVLP